MSERDLTPAELQAVLDAPCPHCGAEPWGGPSRPQVPASALTRAEVVDGTGFAPGARFLPLDEFPSDVEVLRAIVATQDAELALLPEAAAWAYQYAGQLKGVDDKLLDVLAALAEGRAPELTWPAS